ncbi:SHOCT domain-containing protein [Mycolicibacterium sp. 120266]|uniref:SHOCT domain-containing protein n=1 Tax=Mycolicibacterium sp. 120266 TaxID=3090601 RepID=UPI00299E349F|nr:SHOCT domain-containing protein [Mycolicibacterium sp. 120266]MDX1875688.1 SHOCT domain-containing protein [Mycolicibacterium sp. 120266]
MLWRYVKAQLMVLLCGGLVGPIFLAVYFATGESDLLKWMFWAGLLVTAADVLIALGLANFGARSAARTQALEATGVLALAQITGMAETNTRINDQPLVKLNLHVSGPGITPFTAEDRVIASVTRLGTLTARKVVVLVDPATNQFQIDWERSALVNGLVPATFTIEEDHRTYDLSGQVGPLMEILQILKANNIGMNSMIDLRSNPAARAQVQAVVRRAGAQQQPTAPPAAAAPAAYVPPAPPAPSAYVPPAPPAPSAAQRLQELETLRATGAISEDEYTSKRQQIIAEL